MKEINREQTLEPAGFWRRIAAGCLDDTIIWSLGCILAFIIIAFLMIVTEWEGKAFLQSLSNESLLSIIYDNTPRDVFNLKDTAMMTLAIISGSYIAAFESSKLQATVGGYLVGIKILNKDGSSLGFLKSFFRSISMTVTLFLASFLSCIAAFFSNPDISDADLFRIANMTVYISWIIIVILNIGFFIYDDQKRFLQDIIFRTRIVR